MDLDDHIQSNVFGLYSVESYNESVAGRVGKGNIVVLHQNIRSFNANGDYLSVFLDSLKSKPNVIILTETWFC